MFEIFASRARPTAASQAANTRITIGIGNIIIEWVFRGVIVARINRESIIPSRHRRVDIRCDRNNRVPRNEKIKAKVILSTAGVIFGNYDVYHNLMSRNH